MDRLEELEQALSTIALKTGVGLCAMPKQGLLRPRGDRPLTILHKSSSRPLVRKSLPEHKDGMKYFNVSQEVSTEEDAPDD